MNPALLGGLLLVSVPIIIWLLHRFRFRTVEWAAQTFLIRALKRSQRRLRLENLLLLLIRCLVVALFVIALARPRGGPSVLADPNDAHRNVVILIDTSYSTGYQLGSDAQETVFEHEKRAAKDLVRHLRGVDRLAVIAFDDLARVIYPTPLTVDENRKKNFQDDLESLPELQRTARGTDYAAAFAALPSLLRRFDVTTDGQPLPEGAQRPPKAVFLLTDAQRSGLLDAGGKLRDPNIRSSAEAIRSLNAQLQIVDCGADEPRNASITLLETRDPVVGTDMPCIVEAVVKNWSSTKLKGLTFEFAIDGGETPAKAQTIDLEPGEQRPVESLRYVFHDKGPHRVTARLKSDPLVVDNERALVIDVREAVRVLLVDGDPRPGKFESETVFIRKALNPLADRPDVGDARDIFQADVVTEAQLGPISKLRNYDVVVVANVVSLMDEQVAALETYARDGHAVIFTMGNLVDRSSWNEKLWRGGKGLLPCKLGEVRGPAASERSGARDPNAPEWVLALADREHPVLRIFGEEEMRPWLRSPSVFRYVEALDLPGGSTPASAPLRLVPRPRSDEPNARPTPEEERIAKDGAPVLVERPFGRGHASLWLTTIDDLWSNSIMYDGFYVIFWRQYALDLARGALPKRNLAIGDRYERTITGSEYAPNVEVTLPDGSREVGRPEVLDAKEQFRIVYPPSSDKSLPEKPEAPKPGTPQLRRADTLGVERPGLYEVKLTGGASDGATAPLADYFAVRVDPSEGDVSKLAYEDWKEALGLDKDHLPEPRRPETLGEVFLQPGQAAQGNEKWAPFMAAVVGLLALESLLAALFGRRRR